MKRLGSILIAFVMCVMVGTPAFAAEPQEMLSVAVGSSGGSNEAWSERVIVSDEQREVFQIFDDGEEAATDTNSAIEPLATGISGVFIEEIYAYPMLLEVETGELFYVPGIQTGGVLQNQSQSESLRLTTQQAQNLYQELLDYATLNGTAGYHYGIIGWYVDTKIGTRADYPMYVKYTVGTPNYSGITEERTVNITTPGQWVRVAVAMGFPDNYSDTEYYHMDVLDGTFTYRGAFNNKILSIPFSAGLSFNYDAA